MSVVVTAPPSPYKGLAPFEDSDLDALLFFGRERESEVIAANLMAARITVLYGPSGVGKSSVLRAGVAHRLRQEEGVEVVVFSTWTGNPVAALIEAAGGSGGSLATALEDTAANAGGDLYLILDQFEELFLYHPRGGRFAEQLAEVLRAPGLRVNVLIGIREDALARLDALKAAIPNLLANRLRLDRLDRMAGGAAIVGPIGRYNTLVDIDEAVEVEPALVEDVLDEVTAGRVELSVAGRGIAAGGADEGRIEAPYLQLVLARLWEVESERGSRTLRQATLRELGGAERIVEDHLERAMAALSPREKGAAAAMYNFLVTPSGTKIAHGVHDLAGYAAVDEREASEVLQRLSAERIVRASAENGPATTRYEIFHDVLADAVLGWRARFEADRRVEEQRQAHERRQRRLLVFGAVTLIGLAVMAAVAAYAFSQRSNARHQAAVAQLERAAALRLSGIAQQRRKDAVHQAAVAKLKTREARLAETRAKHAEGRARMSARRANAAKFEALAQTALAEGNRVEAIRLAAAAAAASRLAERQATLARAATRKAVHAELLATRQRNLAHARELLASARALLDDDSAASVRASLAAIAAYRAAKLSASPAEGVLRDGLLALRLRAVLPAGGAVRSAQISPDGSLVLVAGKGGARLYDLAHGYRVRRLEPSSALVDASFSADGRLVAGVGAQPDHDVRIWETQTGATVAALAHQAAVLSVAFAPSGKLVATGSVDGKARVWSIPGGKLVGVPLSHDSGVRGNDVRMVSFSPDSSRLVTVGGDRFARIFDLDHFVEFKKLNHVTLVNAARFSHDGRIVATGGAAPSSGDAVVRLWNAGTGGQIEAFKAAGQTTDVVFSQDDSLLAATGSVDTTARVWSLLTGDLMAIIGGHRSGVESVAFSPNGRSVLTTGRDGKVFISTSSGGFTQASLLGHRGAVVGGSFSSDAQLVLTASSDGTARLWDAGVDLTGPAPPGNPQLLGTHTQQVNAVAYSPDGKVVLSASADGTVRLWHGDGSFLPLKHGLGVEAASFSRDGKLVITGGDDLAGRIWRTSDGALLATLPHGAVVKAVQLSANGRLAITAGEDGVVRLWDARTGALLRRLDQGHRINDVRFSPNGRFVVTAGSDGTAVIWRVTDGKKLFVLTGHTDEVVKASFSPNGRWIATASADATARIWSAESGRTEHILTGHTDALTALAFSPDGSRLATASADRDGRVWNVRSGDEIALLRIHVSTVNDLAFSFDGRWVATAGPTAAAIWKASKQGRWATLPVYLIRGPTRPLTGVAFSPRGWNLVMGSRDGSVRTYECRLCGGVTQLTSIAKARLRAIARP
jgi:WD40 repeat protein